MLINMLTLIFHNVHMALAKLAILSISVHMVLDYVQDLKAQMPKLQAVDIVGIKFSSFLTPDIASKNDATHGIRLS